MHLCLISKPRKLLNQLGPRARVTDLNSCLAREINPSCKEARAEGINRAGGASKGKADKEALSCGKGPTGSGPGSCGGGA